MTEVVRLQVRSYRDLRVWQEAKSLAIHVYRATDSFPKSEQYGLVNQLRRASVSVASNIAEGHARSTKEYIRFLDIALGSLSELETQIEISAELDFLSKAKSGELLEHTNAITKMLGKMSHSLKCKSHSLAPNPQSPIPRHPND